MEGMGDSEQQPGSLRSKLDRVFDAVLVSNGKPSLIARVDTMERDLKSIAETQTKHLAIINRFNSYLDQQQGANNEKVRQGRRNDRWIALGAALFLGMQTYLLWNSSNRDADMHQLMQTVDSLTRKVDHDKQLPSQ